MKNMTEQKDFLEHFKEIGKKGGSASTERKQASSRNNLIAARKKRWARRVEAMNQSQEPAHGTADLNS